ncbi:MAG: heavy-metal-associated domain-containing protein [Anaerolineales bacterium]
MSQITYSVPRIHCGHCVHTIQTELSEIPGVQRVVAEESSRKVVVEFESPATSPMIEAKLAEINYPPEPLLQL